MPNNTAVREKLKTYLDEFKKNATAGAHYDTFLHALNDLVEKTDALYQRDDQGQYIPMNAESYRGIMNAYKTALDTCGGFMEAEQNENMRVIPGKIQELLAQDVTTLSNLDANHPGTLPQAVAAARGQTVDISGQKTASMGDALSSRIPLSISDGKGGTLEGFFTEETIYDPAGDLRSAVEKITKKYPQHAELFNSLLHESVPAGEALSCARVDVKKWETVEKLEKFLAEHNPNFKETDHISHDAEKALSEFSEMIHKASTQAYVYNECLGVAEKSNIDKRNCAMSMMANLLGNPKLVAKSVPITVINGSETKTGIFMEKVEGVDLDHAPADDPARGYDFNNFSHSEGLRSMAELQVLDYICLNCDRHQSNMLYQFDAQGKFTGVQGIDNDASFGTSVPENDKSVKFTVPVDQMFVISRHMADAIKQLDENMVKTALRGYGLNPKEISAVWKRTQNMQEKILEGEEYFKGKIDEKNLGHVEEGKLRIVEDNEWEHLDVVDLAVKGGRQGVGKGEVEVCNNLFQCAYEFDELFTHSVDSAGREKKTGKKEELAGAAQANVLEGLNKAFWERDKRDLKAVADQLKKADPFYILKGSEQYQKMRDSMKKLTEFSETMAAKETAPTPEEQRRYQALLENANEAGKAYLQYKGGKVDAPTTSREKDRIDAAKALCAMAEQKLEGFKSAAHEAEQEEIEQLNARMKAQAKNIQGFRAKVAALEEGPLKQLGLKAEEAQQNLLMLAGMPTLTPQQQNQAQESMSFMLLYDAANTAREKNANQPSALENRIKTQEDVCKQAELLRKKPGFKKLEKEWKPEELRDFALNLRSRVAKLAPKKVAEGQAAQASSPAAVATRSAGVQKQQKQGMKVN